MVGLDRRSQARPYMAPLGGVPRHSSKREPRPSTPSQGILVVVTGNFLHEHHDPAPQGDIINSHERSHQPQAV